MKGLKIDILLQAKLGHARSRFRYGDKTPRFIFGRLFGVLWILTGLVVIAMFTATTTGALSISSAGLPGIQGIHVRQLLFQIVVLALFQVQ